MRSQNDAAPEEGVHDGGANRAELALQEVEEVWLWSLEPGRLDELAAALEDWGFEPTLIDGEASAAPGAPEAPPAALVIDADSVSRLRLSAELRLRPIPDHVPVVLITEHVRHDGHLGALRSFDHVLVLPNPDVSTVVGALDWAIDLPIGERPPGLPSG